MDILVYKDGRFVCTENPLKADSLEGLAMLVTNPQDGDVLKYDAASGTWLNGTGSDFAPTITSPQNGQVIKYNGTAWVNGTGGGDFAPDITNPQDGDTLVYDGTAGKWVNGERIYYITSTYDESTDTETLNSTWQDIHDAVAARKLCVLVTNTNQSAYMQYLTTVQQEAEDKFAVYFNGDDEYVFYTSTANGYPSYTIT